MNIGGQFTHKPMMEQVKFLENLLKRYASFVMETRTLQAKVMSSVDESSLVESKLIPSLGSTHEPSPEPRTPKERVIHPSEFPIEFKDYGNILKLLRHENHTHPLEEVSPG